jgi:DNA-binding transcriptional ArsR family regulator
MAKATTPKQTSAKAKPGTKTTQTEPPGKWVENDRLAVIGADPLRMRIDHALRYPPRQLTAKELGERLGVAPNTLYYHLRKMEEVGMVKVVEERPAGRVTERVYTADEFLVEYDPAKPEQLVNLAKSMITLAQARVVDATYRYADDPDNTVRPLVVSPAFIASKSEAEAFKTRLNDLQMEFRKRAKEVLGDGPIPEDWIYVESTSIVSTVEIDPDRRAYQLTASST